MLAINTERIKKVSRDAEESLKTIEAGKQPIKDVKYPVRTQKNFE